MPCLGSTLHACVWTTPGAQPWQGPYIFSLPKQMTLGQMLQMTLLNALHGARHMESRCLFLKTERDFPWSLSCWHQAMVLTLRMTTICGHAVAC